MEPAVAREQFLAAVASGDARTVAAYYAQSALTPSVVLHEDIYDAVEDVRTVQEMVLPRHRRRQRPSMVATAINKRYFDVVEWLFSAEAVACIGPEPLVAAVRPACLLAMRANALALLEVILASAVFAQLLPDENQQQLLDELFGSVYLYHTDDMVRLLVAHGASVRMTANNVRHDPVVSMARKATNARSHALIQAIMQEGAFMVGVDVFGSGWVHSESTVRLLLEHGARPAPSAPGLYCAVSHGSVGMTKAWLEVGCIDVDVRRPRGQTPLMLVTRLQWFRSVSYHDDCVAVAKLLLEYGAQVDTKDMDDRTPLRHAITSTYPEIVRCLLENGADPNQPIEGNQVALDFLDLSKVGQECIAKQLEAMLEYGADPVATRSDGLSAMDCLQQTEAGMRFVQAHPQWFAKRQKLNASDIVYTP